MAKNIMKQHTNKHPSKHSFIEGDQVFLHLRPYKQTSLKDTIHKKL
jgi:hypothetical protein